MKRMKFFAGLALFATLASNTACNNTTGSGAAGSDGVVLKFNLEKGKAYNYVMDVSSSQNYEGKNLDSRMSFGYDMEVTDKTDAATTVKTTYNRILVDIPSPQGQVMNFDSDKPVADSAGGGEMNPMSMMSKMLGAMKGKTFTMKVAPDGTVLEIQGISEMADAMVNSMNLPEQNKAMVRQMFTSQFNDESMKQNFGNAFNIYPNKPVKVGEKWEKNATVGLAGNKMQTATTYTVRDVKDNRVTIDVQAAIDMNGGKGTQTGSMVVDTRTGLILEGNTEQKLTQPAPITSRVKITGTEKGR